jgi:asparagine synthase (glutamine-hydrolysing)
METRLPFLDYRLVEFAFSLPLKHKIRDGWTKHLVRRYLERHGATMVAWRKIKLGFNAPQSDWTQSLVREHGGKIQAHPFADTLLKPGIEIDRLPVQQQWDVFVCLQLAGQYDWK